MPAKNLKKETLEEFMARRDPALPLQVCRIRSDLWGKESPPILSEGRVGEDRYFEPEKNEWLTMGDCTPWENEDGVIYDGKFESAHNFCFYLPSGELVWGMSIDFDFEVHQDKTTQKV